MPMRSGSKKDKNIDCPKKSVKRFSRLLRIKIFFAIESKDKFISLSKLSKYLVTIKIIKISYKIGRISDRKKNMKTNCLQKKKDFVHIPRFCLHLHLHFVFTFMEHFLDASTHLYKWVYPSARPSVRMLFRPSVHPSVCP